MKIQVLDPNSTVGLIAQNSFFRDIFDYYAKIQKDDPIEWVKEGGKILVVSITDLQSFEEIHWLDVNLVVAETCQQIYDFSYRLDYTKSYIFVSESWADLNDLKNKFYGLPLVDHYAIFNEIFNYGSELFTPKSHITALEPLLEEPEYDFFCLIGRPSQLRHKFMHSLVKQDLSKSLVKYNGLIAGNSGAPAKFDSLDYRRGFYGGENHIGMYTPSKLIQSSLYNNFKLEVQFETDACGGQGWDLIEYHVTEKTLKPLIMGKPCVMFGPKGYHTWLAQVGIDLGHGNFTTDFDQTEDDYTRSMEVVKIVSQIDFSKVTASKSQKDKNWLGMYQLCNLSKTNTIELYRRLRRI